MHSMKHAVLFLSISLLSIAGCMDPGSNGRSRSEVQRAAMDVKYRDEILNTEIHKFEDFQKLESAADAGAGAYDSLNDRIERESLLGERRRKWYVDNNPSLPLAMQRLILEGRVTIGMTQEQVLASWGWPRDVSRTVTASGTTERWSYGYYIAERNGVRYTHYLYFDDGRVTSWQK